LLVLAAWIFDISWLKAPLPDQAQMKANTAIGLIGLGGGLSLAVWGRSPRTRLVMSVLVGLSVLIGVLTLLEYVLGRSLGIDDLLLRDVRTAQTVHPGRLAPQAAISFVCAGFALLFQSRGAQTTRRLAAGLTALPWLIALFAVVGYAYGVTAFEGLPNLTPIDLPTAVALLVLCVGIAAADPGGAFAGVLTTEGPGSVMARWLLPMVAVLFPILGWVELRGERHGLYSAATGAAIFAVSRTVVVSLAVLRLAGRLNRAASERHAAAAAQRRLGALVDAANESIVSSDLDGMVTSWNRAAETLYGYSEAEMIGRSPIVLYPPDRLAEREQLMSRVARGDSVTDFDTQRLRKDGSRFDVSLTISRLMVDGAPVGFCVVSRDITARVQALRSSEERYRLLFDRNPLPVWVYERDSLRIVAVSDAAVADYGYSRGELLSMTVAELLAPADYAELQAHRAATDGRGRTGPLAAEPHGIRCKDGTIVEVEVTGDDVVLDGREYRMALCHDVTERNRAVAEVAMARDQAVEASNMKSAFLANMSHEIRTPMNGVIGMNELLLGTRLTNAQRGYAEQAIRSGEQMLAIINDILDISKIETGHVQLDITDFDLHASIADTCSAAGLEAEAKGLRFEIELSSAVPRRARGDGRRFQQVLLNLVSNAVKFTSDGAVTVRVSATRTPRETTAVAVEVADDGIGIDPEALEHMFEPFTQADGSTTRIYGGTGLGLAIAREIVQLMGGTIGAESTPGRGSTFRFQVELAAPLVDASPQIHAGDTATASPIAGPGAPLVLIAEDSKVNQIVAARAVERCGYRVHVVDDGIAALEALRTQHYDAVLMDCQMPNLDGYETTIQLRRLEGPNQRCPVIAVTAHAMDGDRQRCLDAGMDDYVTKPMRHADVADTLSRWIPAKTDPSSTVDPGEEEPAPAAQTPDRGRRQERSIAVAAPPEYAAGDAPPRAARTRTAAGRGSALTRP
jgi:PAS domain S-box-containing protein